MSVQWLVNWWNLIFLMPFALALMYLGLYTVSGITFGESSADADLDHDLDMDHDMDASADHDASMDQDADADHDASADHDADHDHDAGTSAQTAVMHWMGVGRVPLSIILMVLFLSWGVSGFLINAAMQDRGEAVAAISIPAAAIISLLITHLVGLFIGRFLPLYETSAQRRHALLGSIGEAILPIDQRFGMVSVRDSTGDLYQLPCRTEESFEPIPKGTKVKLVAYNAKQTLFYVSRQGVEQAIMK